MPFAPTGILHRVSGSRNRLPRGFERLHDQRLIQLHRAPKVAKSSLLEELHDLRPVFAPNRMEATMHGIIYLIGLIVVIMAILSFFGLR
jgi:hypothetical protein